MTGKEQNAEQLNELHETDLNELIEKFREEGKVLSPTFHYWDQLLVEILMPFKVYMAATGKSQWAPYHAAKAAFLPLLFAANRTNYSQHSQ